MKKSVGFNWGPSAVSTTYWTGFRLSDLLKHCGAKTPLEGARYVHFKGVAKELPQVRQQQTSLPVAQRPPLLQVSACNASSKAARDQAPCCAWCPSAQQTQSQRKSAVSCLGCAVHIYILR